MMQRYDWSSQLCLKNNSSLNGIQTSAILMQWSTDWANNQLNPTESWPLGEFINIPLEDEGFNFKTAQVVSIIAMINHIFISSSTVQIIWNFIHSLVFFIFYTYIKNSQSGRLPAGLIAQLVQHCTSITQVMGSNPIQEWIFFRLQFHNCWT